LEPQPARRELNSIRTAVTRIDRGMDLVRMTGSIAQPAGGFVL
jgi:hypothetical protein